MGGSPLGRIFRAAHEFRGREGHRLGTAHNMVSQQAIVRGAQANRPCSQPKFDTVLFRLHEEIPFGLAAVPSVATATLLNEQPQCA